MILSLQRLSLILTYFFSFVYVIYLPCGSGPSFTDQSIELRDSINIRWVDQLIRKINVKY